MILHIYILGLLFITFLGLHEIVFLAFNQNKNYKFKMFLLYFIDILKSNIYMYIKEKITFTKLLCVNLKLRQKNVTSS